MLPRVGRKVAWERYDHCCGGDYGIHDTASRARGGEERRLAGHQAPAYALAEWGDKVYRLNPNKH